MSENLPMKSFEQDGGECLRKWHRTHRERLLGMCGEPPSTLCIDEVNLTVCCRYSESLLKNCRINRYLRKQHPKELRALENLLNNFESSSQISIHPWKDDPAETISACIRQARKAGIMDSAVRCGLSRAKRLRQDATGLRT
jgi:hypothetical protein